jgi:Protein of unknown function (DUF3618)
MFALKPQAGSAACGVVARAGEAWLLACAIIARADTQDNDGGTARMTAQEREQEIERTREHLGETIDELAGKADMKARARAGAAGVKARAADVAGRVQQSQVLQRRWPVAVAAGVLIAGSVIIWRRRKRA